VPVPTSHACIPFWMYSWEGGVSILLSRWCRLACQTFSLPCLPPSLPYVCIFSYSALYGCDQTDLMSYGPLDGNYLPHHTTHILHTHTTHTFHTHTLCYFSASPQFVTGLLDGATSHLHTCLSSSLRTGIRYRTDRPPAILILPASSIYSDGIINHSYVLPSLITMYCM